MQSPTEQQVQRVEEKKAEILKVCRIFGQTMELLKNLSGGQEINLDMSWFEELKREMKETDVFHTTVFLSKDWGSYTKAEYGYKVAQYEAKLERIFTQKGFTSISEPFRSVLSDYIQELINVFEDR